MVMGDGVGVWGGAAVGEGNRAGVFSRGGKCWKDVDVEVAEGWVVGLLLVVSLVAVLLG